MGVKHLGRLHHQGLIAGVINYHLYSTLVVHSGHRSGVSNIRPDTAHWIALENVKDSINFGFLTLLFFNVLQFFLQVKTLPWPFILHQSNQVTDKQLNSEI